MRHDPWDLVLRLETTGTGRSSVGADGTIASVNAFTLIGRSCLEPEFSILSPNESLDQSAVLIVDDEPFIALDLAMAVEDAGGSRRDRAELIVARFFLNGSYCSAYRK